MLEKLSGHLGAIGKLSKIVLDLQGKIVFNKKFGKEKIVLF